jgi:PPOX class probable F420-dependent enzyme
MPSRRDQIKMTDEELRDFVAEHKIVTCATIGPNGRPHLMPLWYVADGLELRGWTYAKSQKAVNLERDPHATVQIEDGLQYQELRGVMMECNVVLERDSELVGDYGVALFERFAEGGQLSDEVREMVRGQAPKRVGLHFKPTRIVTWDHRKLAGVY